MAEAHINVKPYLKWAGGKRQLLAQINKYVPPPDQIGTYYEPFVGAGALLFSLRPGRAVINDANSQLVMTYLAVRERVEELIQLLEYHKEHNCREYYYQVRDEDRKEGFQSRPQVEKAARLIYLNKTCFNGLYRVNSQGLFNVPYGKYKKPLIYEPEVLLAVSRYLNQNNIQVLNGDFEAALKQAREDSFVYFDPPYHSQDNTNFTGYQAGGFGDEEQIRLCRVMKDMTKRGIRCLQSNSDTPFIKELYQDKEFKVITVTANRAINANATGRGRVNEVLIRNY